MNCIICNLDIKKRLPCGHEIHIECCKTYCKGLCKLCKILNKPFKFK